MEDVEVVAVCDLMEEKARETAEKFQINQIFTDYKKMIEKTNPDAVYILMPPYHLYDLAVHCLKEGLPTFMDKPPGVYREQTRQMANLPLTSKPSPRSTSS